MCARSNVGDRAKCDYTDFMMRDEWTDGAFVEVGDNRAVLIYDIKGSGDNLDCAPSRPDSCSIYMGYHCAPYECQVIY